MIGTHLTIPAILSNDHSLDGFNCGNPTLDKWLKRYAMLNQQANSARTFVVCKEKSVIGYYALAVGSIEHKTAGKRIKKGLARHPIPVMKITVNSFAVFSQSGSGTVFLHTHQDRFSPHWKRPQ